MTKKNSQGTPTGRTIFDLLFELARRRFFWGILVCVIAGFLVSWGIIHVITEPGSQISVWGLIKYTKKKSEERGSPSPAPSPASTTNNEGEFVTAHIPDNISLKAAINLLVTTDNSVVAFKDDCSESLLSMVIRGGDIRAKTTLDLINQLQYRLKESEFKVNLLVTKSEEKGIYEITCTS